MASNNWPMCSKCGVRPTLHDGTDLCGICGSNSANSTQTATPAR